MANNLQQQVDAYETAGLGTLQKMQQQNPKLLVGIALENLQKDMQADQRAKSMPNANVGPSVIDKKLAGLSGLGLGQQEALSTARPGLQQRGQQMRASQLAQAMQQAQRRPAGGIASMPMMRNQMRRMAEGGDVEGEDTGFLATLRKLDEGLKADEAARQAERMARGRRLSDYIPVPGGGSYYLPAKNLMYDIGQGVSGLANLLKRRPAEEAAPEPFDVQGRIMELIRLRENANDEAKARIDDEMRSFAQDDVIAARRRMSGMQAGGAVKKYAGPEGSQVISDTNPETGLPYSPEEYAALLDAMEAARGTSIKVGDDTMVDASRLPRDPNRLTPAQESERDLAIIERAANPTREDLFNRRLRQAEEFTGADESYRDLVGDMRALAEAEARGDFGPPGTINPELIRRNIGTGLERSIEFLGRSGLQAVLNAAAAGEYGLGSLKDILGYASETGTAGEIRRGAEEEVQRLRGQTQTRLGEIEQQLNALGGDISPELRAQLEAERDRLTQNLSDLQGAGLRYRFREAMPSFDDLRGIQEFIAGTPIGQEMLNQSANRQEAREAEEIERRRAGELERLEAGLTPEQKATRALRQGRPQELFFPKTDEEEKSRAGLQPEKTPMSDKIFSLLQTLGDFSGAPKGYEGATFLARRRAREEAAADRQARADLLTEELEGRFNLMEEQERLRSEEARKVALAEYAGDLTDLEIQSDPEFMQKAQELKEMYGPGFFGLGGDEAKLQAELIDLYNKTRARKIGEMSGYLGLDTTGQAGPVQDYSNYRPSTGQ